MTNRIPSIDRRGFLGGLGAAGLGAGALGAAGLSAFPGAALAQGRRNALLIGLDIGDSITFDPARLAQYSSPMTLKAVYDTLITMAPGDYINLKPNLATSWEYRADGKAVRFKLRQGLKFASGNPVRAEDVKWSIERVINLKDQPAQYIAHVQGVDIVGADTVDVVLKDPTQPILTILAAPSFAIMDSKLLATQGATAAADAKDADKATTWLNGNSAGSGPYSLTAWERNQQIQMVRNANYWGEKPGFERVVIRHMSESAAQLLALKRGDIDVAFNLIPEQIATIKGDPQIDLIGTASLDYIYMAVSENAEANPALNKKQNRHAIGCAMDYDGIINSLIGGSAVRPANFLPVGVNGATAETTKEIGFKQDLDRAKKLLAEAGNPDGFAFELTYSNNAIAGVSYQNLAQKLQADLARVGIKANLNPIDQVNLRTLYNQGKLQAVLTFWNPPAVENQLWASATVNRVAKRVHWTPPADMMKLVDDASAERDLGKAAALWRTYQQRMVDAAHLFVLIQPVYQIAVRKTVTGFKPTAAGWMAELGGAKPA
ncbi:MAG: ABC transporter substrate-binding protein [Alphaproteobacteria bacterium]|nr:ABC transporter substrate-binding protein [Alphaproteobacteria bacterium]